MSNPETHSHEPHKPETHILTKSEIEIHRDVAYRFYDLTGTGHNRPSKVIVGALFVETQKSQGYRVIDAEKIGSEHKKHRFLVENQKNKQHPPRSFELSTFINGESPADELLDISELYNDDIFKPDAVVGVVRLNMGSKCYICFSEQRHRQNHEPYHGIVVYLGKCNS